MLIAIMGIDGSGKTTQTMLLYKALRKIGYKVKATYAGNTGIKLGKTFSFYLSLPLDIFINRLVKMKKQDFYKRYPKLARLEEFLLFLNYILLVLPKVCLYRFFFKVIIADRYVYDYILSCIAYSKPYSKTLIRILFRITQKPDLTILLDVDEEVAYARKCGEKPIDDLKKLRRLYLSFIAKIKGEIIQTYNRPAIRTFKDLLSLVMEQAPQMRR
ncbi:MAG: hypothetical protein QXZ17_02255 [Nitrososphaerota archaeon]